MDDIIPPCRTATGCSIPALTPAAERLQRLRSVRIRLGDMVDAGTVCRAFEAEYGPIDWQDLEILAQVEQELRAELQPDKQE